MLSPPWGLSGDPICGAARMSCRGADVLAPMSWRRAYEGVKMSSVTQEGAPRACNACGRSVEDETR